MNRSEKLKKILQCEALADVATAIAKAEREELEAEAFADYAKDGVIPTWPIEDATATMTFTPPDYQIIDERTWIDWVHQHYPTEIQQIIQARPAWQKSFLTELTKRGDIPCTEDGEVIPGLAYIPGNTPRGLGIRRKPGVRAAYAEAAEQLISQLLIPEKGE